MGNDPFVDFPGEWALLAFRYTQPLQHFTSHPATDLSRWRKRSVMPVLLMLYSIRLTSDPTHEDSRLVSQSDIDWTAAAFVLSFSLWNKSRLSLSSAHFPPIWTICQFRAGGLSLCLTDLLVLLVGKGEIDFRMWDVTNAPCLLLLLGWVSLHFFLLAKMNVSILDFLCLC